LCEILAKTLSYPWKRRVYCEYTIKILTDELVIKKLCCIIFRKNSIIIVGQNNKAEEEIMTGPLSGLTGIIRSYLGIGLRK